jgi:hypothetical protein
MMTAVLLCSFVAHAADTIDSSGPGMCQRASKDATSDLTAVYFPGPKPGPAKGSVNGTTAELENDVISMSWNIGKTELAPAALSNKLTRENFPQAGAQLFRLGTEEQTILSKRVGIRMDARNVYVYSTKANGEQLSLAVFLRDQYAGSPKVIRVGKLSPQAVPIDYGAAGAMGSCMISKLTLVAGGTAIPAETMTKGWTVHKSSRAGTAVDIVDGQFRIAASANSAAAAERDVPDDATEFSCLIDKGTDSGMSWSPALALVWPNGRFILVGLREGHEPVFNVSTPEGEQIFGDQGNSNPFFDLVSGRDFMLSSAVIAKPIKADSKGIRGSERFGGQAIEASFDLMKTGLRVLWRAELRDGSSYIRQTFTLQTLDKTVPLRGVELVDVKIREIATMGSSPGSPVAGHGCFFGLEMPGARNRISPTGVRIGVTCQLDVCKEQPYSFSTVTGVFPEGQLRRSFLFYLERERARPSTPFLHYNCWYDLGLAVSEKGMLDVVEQFDRELVQKRGVPVKSFLVDDGWDNPDKGLWIENEKKFADGFRGLKTAMEKSGSHLGIWISPLGGYTSGTERTAHARKMGLIPEHSGLDLAHPAYKAWFQNRCLQLMREDGVNSFKWDKAGDGVSPHFMALLDIASVLRRKNSEVFINVTVGTWPSPFWLNHIDTTWRDGTGDVGWVGVGDDREQWLTFRDDGCYHRFVVPAPLYPLNSVMHHGIVHGRLYQGEKVGKAGAHLKNEARSYFGNGAMLQELYLTPSMMTPDAWDRVAEAAKWASDHAWILVDSHWVGGDPHKLEPYGYAAWSPKGAVLTLRNPSDKPQEISLDAATVFELPANAPRTYELKASYADQRLKNVTLKSGQPEVITLTPFEVLVFDWNE